jgi:hypothetical protein
MNGTNARLDSGRSTGTEDALPNCVRLTSELRTRIFIGGSFMRSFFNGALFLSAAAIAACGGAPDHQVAAPAVQLGLTIDANTSTLLSGSLRDQERVIDFAIERNGDVRSTTIRNSAGEVILRATASGDREKLELGTAATVEGPRGAVFNGSATDAAEVKVTGDAASADAAKAQPDFVLAVQLIQSLAARPELDAEDFPRLARTEANAGEYAQSTAGLGNETNACRTICECPPWWMCLVVPFPFCAICDCFQICDV